MKKILCFVLTVLCFSLTVVAEGSTVEAVKISVNTVAADGKVAVEISYKSDGQMSAGNMDIVYNSNLLKLESYETGEDISNITHFVNENYADDTIRFNWASISPLGKNGDMMKLEFSISESVFSESDISLGAVKCIDENGQKLQTEVEYSVENHMQKQEEEESNSGKPARPSGGGGSGRVTASPDSKADEKASKPEWVNPFEDIKEDSWYYEYVKFVAENGVMNGISSSVFSPDSNVTRAMFVTVLYRMENEPETSFCGFDDVGEGTWYSDSIAWAASNNIVNGVSEKEFKPEMNITREQMATILFRYAQFKKYDVSVNENADISVFSDYKNISEYAEVPMKYAVEKSLIKGKTDSLLKPGDFTTRAEVATILKRFAEYDKIVS